VKVDLKGEMFSIVTIQVPNCPAYHTIKSLPLTFLPYTYSDFELRYMYVVQFHSYR